MKLGLSTLTQPLTSLVVLLSLTSAVNANFDLYSGFYNNGPGSIQNPTQGVWYIFDSDPSCNDVLHTQLYERTNDVSGTKLGVRCVGAGCLGDPSPTEIEVIEMHFSNNPLFHWTIYRDRGSYDMIGLDGKVYGNCDPFPDNDFSCTSLSVHLEGRRKIRCYTQFTAAQINAAF